MKVIIAAAGTGGHINPGLAIANKIKEENKDAKIIFIGTVRGLENDLVPRSGYELRTIEAYGINRKISINNIRNLFKTAKGYKQARKIVEEIRPDIVIGTGGYICGPVIFAAIKNNIPTMLHESNAFPGIAVKLLSKKVDTVLVGFKEAIERLPKAKNVVVTGTPTKMIGTSYTEEEKEVIKREAGIKTSLPIVLIFGGSQGAQSINETLIEIIKNKSNTDYQIIWACGPKQYDIIKEKLSGEKININNIQNAKIVPYIYNMEEIMSIADVIISRSGAMTITEISKTGKPAIFIPFPFATENHQEYNAKVLENVGAAKIILDKDLNATVLSSTLKDMMKDKEVLTSMGEKAKSIAITDVEDRIYKEIKKLLKI